MINEIFFLSLFFSSKLFKNSLKIFIKKAIKANSKSYILYIIYHNFEFISTVFSAKALEELSKKKKDFEDLSRA